MTSVTTLPGRAPLGPALDLLRDLSQLNHALERLSIHMERSLGVTAQQRLLIRCIGKYPGIAPGELATLLHVDPGTISASLTRLIARELVQRRTLSTDKRRASLHLTAGGRRIDRPMKGTVENAVLCLVADASSNDITVTKKLIAQLVSLLTAEHLRSTPSNRGTEPRSKPVAMRSKSSSLR